MANLTALAVAIEVKLVGDMTGAVLYRSDQTHASNNKALKILGFRPDQHRSVSTNSDFQLDWQMLNDLIARDRSDRRRPFCVIANAGTTNTGAVDPLAALVKMGKTNDMWIQVDGAFGRQPSSRNGAATGYTASVTSIPLASTTQVVFSAF